MKYNIFNVKKCKLSVIPWGFLVLIFFMLSATIVFSVIPKSLAAQTTMEVYQQEGQKVFGKETSFDIFNDSKLGGQKLVHPFTEGSYTFAIYNNANSDPLPYSLDITGTNPDEIPLIFSLQKNGEYVYGGEGKPNMIPLSEINFPETLLNGKKTDIYTVKWEWKTESDIIDTAIGNDGTQLYTLIIKATGTILETNVPITGDRSNIFIWFFVMLVSILLLFILPFRKRKKDEDENNQSSSNNI